MPTHRPMTLFCGFSLSVSVLLALCSSFALAQDAGIEPLMPAMRADDSTARPAQLDRDFVEANEEAVLPPVQYELEPDAALQPPTPAVPSVDPGNSPGMNPAVIESPNTESQFDLRPALKASFRTSVGGSTAFFLDDTLAPTAITPLTTRIRVAPELSLYSFTLATEVDAITGAIVGVPRVSEGIAQLPNKAELDARITYPLFHPIELRKLYLEYKFQSGVFRVGQQTSNWGLGLLANDGAQDAEPGEFGQKHWGNLTYRALVSLRPFYSMGKLPRAFEAIVAADLLVRDNFADFSLGDRAFQGVLAVRFAKNIDNYVGFYGVYRSQRNINVTDGSKATDAFVFDVAAQWDFIKNRREALRMGIELVTIQGTTTQARNESAALLRLNQFALAVKGYWRFEKFSLMFNTGFASGDQNPNDGSIENFRIDRDYKVGLILYDHIQAFHSARGAARASDRNIVGIPAEGSELLGTAGSISSSFFFFPRLKFDLSQVSSIYAGPLLAFSTAKNIDAYNTRINGGVSTNAVGGSPGSYLGTEIDVGAQTLIELIKPLRLQLTLEGGLFVPGDAFRLKNNELMGPVGLARLRATLLF
jgi:hypothetical protein